MPDLIAGENRGLKIVYGRPEVVEDWIEAHRETYVITSCYFYVVGDHLEVAVNAIHQREVRKAQLGSMSLQPGQRRQ